MMDRPGVGTGVYIRKDGKILMGLRKGEYGYGTWCPPGGKLDMHEEWEACARRETREEAGIEIENVRFLAATNDSFPEIGMHYITLAFAADWKSGDVRLMEPDKFERWEWFAWEALPEPLFAPTRNFVETTINPIKFLLLSESSSHDDKE